MTRYFHVAPKAELELVIIAIEQDSGCRNVLGQPIVGTHYVVRGPCTVDRHPDGTVARVRGNVVATTTGTTSCFAPQHLIEGADGTCALEISASDPDIGPRLGKTVQGVAVPRLSALVSVASAGEHSKLPDGVCAKLDDAFVEAAREANVLRRTPKTDAAVDAEVAAEIGAARLAAVKTRATGKAARAALDAALGVR